MSGATPARPLVLIVDDDSPFRRIVADRVQRRGHAVLEAADGRQALALLAAHPVAVCLLDLRMPHLDGLRVLEELQGSPAPPRVLVLTGHGTIGTAVEAMKLGAADYLCKPVDPQVLDRALDRCLATARHTRTGRVTARGGAALDAIVGRAPPMLRLKRLIQRVAATDATVLVRGETGTGKELAARAVHGASRRAAGPFVVLNAATLSDTLALDALGGHVAGAYTGATTPRPGLLDAAAGGTLFVDEVAELSPRVQSQLLHIVENRTFRPLGATGSVSADVRFVFATNQDLEAMVERGTFRRDLYFRLQVVQVTLPPLRERVEDIPALARHFVQELAADRGVALQLEPSAVVALQQHPFPGNVRELRNALERAAVLSADGVVRAADLPARPAVLPDHDAWPTLAVAERRAIQRALQTCGGNRTRAAALLGIHVRTLQRKLARTESAGDEPAGGAPSPPA